MDDGLASAIAATQEQVNPSASHAEDLLSARKPQMVPHRGATFIRAGSRDPLFLKLKRARYIGSKDDMVQRW